MANAFVAPTNYPPTLCLGGRADRDGLGNENRHLVWSDSGGPWCPKLKPEFPGVRFDLPLKEGHTTSTGARFPANYSRMPEDE